MIPPEAHGMMRLLTWNVNHRATRKRIPEGMSDAIGSLSPDVVVLTEYVPGPTREEFVAGLGSVGLGNVMTTPRVAGQNSILIASRTPLVSGDIFTPAIDPAFPSNGLHVHVPRHDIEILGLRIPDYSRSPALRRECWDWIESVASALRFRPSAILGDLNTDPSYPQTRCGDRFGRMESHGWSQAKPSGSSYWTVRGSQGRQLDHAFLSPHFQIHDATYIRESSSFTFAGPGTEALSDHAPLLVEVVRPSVPVTTLSS